MADNAWEKAHMRTGVWHDKQVVHCFWLGIATDIALRGLRYNMQRTAARSQELLNMPLKLFL